MWAGVLVGTFILIGIGALVYLFSWLQGEGFRHYLERQLASAARAQQVTVPEDLVVDGAHLTLPRLSIAKAGILQELNIRRLHIEIERSALLRRALRLRQFSAEEMQITLANPGELSTPTHAPAKGHTAKPSTAQPQAAAPLPLLQPSRGQASSGFIREISARSFECPYTDTTLVLGGHSFGLRGYHLAAVPRPDIGKDAWAVSAENGRITTPFSWLKESGVKRATIFYRGNEVQLSEARVLLTPGHLCATGSYRLDTGLWQGHIDIAKANVARILSSDWRKRLTGTLSGRMDMNGSATGGEWEARGELHLENGIIEGLPFLSDIEVDGTYPYRHMALETARCRISYPYSEPELGIHDAWLWDQINIRAHEGALLVRGRVLTGRDGSLSGSLSIGVPTKIVAALGLAKSALVQQLFNAPSQMPGYMWVQVNLSGTIDAPQEDLSVRLSTILPELLPHLADQAVKSLHSIIETILPGGGKPTEKKDDETEETEPHPPLPIPLPQVPEGAQEKVETIINSGLRLFH